MPGVARLQEGGYQFLLESSCGTITSWQMLGKELQACVLVCWEFSFALEFLNSVYAPSLPFWNKNAHCVGRYTTCSFTVKRPWTFKDFGTIDDYGNIKSRTMETFKLSCVCL